MLQIFSLRSCTFTLPWKRQRVMLVLLQLCGNSSTYSLWTQNRNNLLRLNDPKFIPDESMELSPFVQLLSVTSQSFNLARLTNPSFFCSLAIWSKSSLQFLRSFLKNSQTIAFMGTFVFRTSSQQIILISLSYSTSYYIIQVQLIQGNGFIYNRQIYFRMTTEIKPRKAWEEIMSPFNEKKGGDCFEDGLIGYNFLRNIWGTYFFDRQEISSQDKIDHINKIVGMMKAQVKLMINHQANSMDRPVCSHVESQGAKENFNFLLVELEKTKEALERSKMREEELSTRLMNKQTVIERMERQNNGLKEQLFEMKQSKNKSEEKIIELSNKVYELERGYFMNMSNEYQHHDEANTTLDQYSAISIDKQEERPRVSLFSKRDQVSFDFYRALNDEIRSEEGDAKEKEELGQFDLNIPLRVRNPLKGSLQIYDKQQLKIPTSFIQQMKKMKIKTERIVQIQSDRMSQKDMRRKTMAAPPATLNTNGLQTQRRRFRRIRC